VTTQVEELQSQMSALTAEPTGTLSELEEDCAGGASASLQAMQVRMLPDNGLQGGDESLEEEI